jgi:hypothetical protein
MIDRVYQTVRMLANTEIRGNMKPSDFDKALYNVICEIYEEYSFELNRWTNRLNKGLVSPGDQNIVDLLQEKINFHLVSFVPLAFASAKFTLPADLRYLQSIIYTTANSEVSLCKNATEFNLLKRFEKTQPSTDFPIGFRTGNKVEILPDTINGGVVATYRRNPIIPKWTYVVFNGAELFNPSASDFKDIDLHPSEFDHIVSRLCVKFGINLKEEDLKAAGNEDDVQTFTKENSN